MSQMNKTLAGRYVLKELIGQGGMADVYLAEDIILKRFVAVKIMRSSLNGDPVYVTRFHREARAAAALSHKNIVEIYDVGDEDDDYYYIVMEYVPGQTLKELIHKRGALHYVEAVDVMKQVVSATVKAHSMGIIHRDLKPQNIYVTDSGVVKIGDFGIASIQSLSQVTQTDTIMGSLHYLAPEIARGEKATVQSDIYALGIVFYELLRGEVPFNGESPVNIALKHMRDEIPSVRDFNPSIPQAVENIIIKATAKNIHDRYQYAQDMLDDLLTCLEREEEKIVFTYEEDNNGPTIVADDKKFFTQTHVQSIPEVVEEETSKKIIDKKKIGIISGCVTGAIVLCVAIYFLFLKPVNNFAMPNLVGMTQEEAQQKLTEKELELDQIHQELSDQDEGIVISSDPLADSAVKKGDKVSITVSSGKYIVIENYIDKNYTEVYAELKAKNIQVKKEEQVSDDFAKGVIMDQSLSVGTKLDPNGSDLTITLTVSKGVEITVPNVLGEDVTKAKKILEDAGFVVTLNELTPPTTAAEIKNIKANVVMKQSLQAFSVVYKKYEPITLDYYSKVPDLPAEEPVSPTPDEPEDNTTPHQPDTNQNTTN